MALVFHNPGHGMKTCTNCQQQKPRSAFRPRSSMPHLLQSLCRDCERATSKTYKQSAIGKVNQSSAETTYKRSDKGKRAQKQSKLVQQVRNGDRLAARSTLKHALAAGQVKRWPMCAMPDCCESIVEAHHPDYSRPLDVVWLCPEHHDELHRHT